MKRVAGVTFPTSAQSPQQRSRAPRMATSACVELVPISPPKPRAAAPATHRHKFPAAFIAQLARQNDGADEAGAERRERAGRAARAYAAPHPRAKPAGARLDEMV